MSATQRVNSHPTDEQLHDFNLGRLGDEAAVALGEHLEYCAMCCQALRDLPDDPFLVRLKGVADTDRFDRAPFPQLTDYQIVRELGRGGMGVVYEAEQLSLKRRVAVKLLPAQLNEGDALERFHRESRLAARLHHTNVVPVFEVGHEGVAWFYVMQLITGRSLDRVIAQLRAAARSNPPTKNWGKSPDVGTGESAPGPMDSTLCPESPRTFGNAASNSLPCVLPAPLPGLGPQEVARIGLQVAEALAYAHDRGVLHRDIKPSNLLLDDRGTVWVTDFGLAKAENDDLTGTGAVVGTLRYMAPERFGGACDARADVYALGCTLYELVALRPAFDAVGTAEAVRQVLESVPPRLHSLNPSVPRDLETIIHKAMDRDRDRRYQSAQELADDLRRFLTGLPTRARPPGPAEHLARWARRNRGLAAALVVITVLVLTGLTGLGLATAKFRNQADTERKLAGEAETERTNAVQANEEASRALHRAETTLTDLYASHGLIAGERGDAPRAMLWFANAARLAAQDPDRARINRVRTRTWARQATLPVRAFGHDGENLRLMSFRPGTGDLLLTVTDLGRYRVWDWAREETLPWADGGQSVHAACWSPDGRWLALGLPREVEIREIPSGKVVQRVPRKGPANALAFSPDGRWLAANGNGLHIWDCSKNAFTGPGWMPRSRIRALTFSPRGERLAVVLADADKQVRMFAVTDGRLGDKPLYDPLPHNPPRNQTGPHGNASLPLPPVFTNDGRILVTVIGNGRLARWNTDTGLPAGDDPLVTEINYVHELVASPNGQAFAIAGDGGAHGPQIWNATEYAAGGTFSTHANKVSALAFSPNGRELLSVSWDRTARLWSVPNGQPVGHVLPHQDMVYNAAYSPDGLHFATGQRAGLVRVWRRPVPDAGERTVPLSHFAVRLKPSRDGRYVIPGKFGGPFYPSMSAPALGVYDTTSGAALGPDFQLGSGVADAAVAGDGQTAAAVMNRDGSGTLHLWNPRTAGRIVDAVQLPGVPAAVAFNADDSQVGVLCDTGDVLLFAPQTGRELLRFQLEDWRPGRSSILSLAFAPRTESGAGGTLVVMHSDGSVRLYDEKGGSRGAAIRGPKGSWACGSFRIALDGRRLAVAWGGKTHAVQVFDLGSGAALSDPLPHPDTVFDICFTLDGSRIFTGCRDGQARLWDWKAHRQICPPCTHTDEVYGVAVTPDGLWGFTACRKGNNFRMGSVHCWEFTTGKPVAPAVHFAEGSAHSVVISPDGRRALASVERVGLRSLSLTDLSAPDEMGPDDLCMLASLAAGQRLYEGDVSGLGSNEWFSLWRAFRQKHPAYGTPAFGNLQAGAPPAAPSFNDLWFLADRHARKGEWRQAADALDRAIRLRPNEHWMWYCRATLLAEVSDLDSYRRHCRAMLERFGDTQQPEVAERIAKAWLLLPGVLDPEPATPLVDRALERGAKHELLMWFHLAKAISEYRRGRFEAAITHLEASRTLNATTKQVYLEALDLLFLAMSYKCLGKDADADRWLDLAQKHMDKRFPKADADLRGVWHDHVMAGIVRREAEALFRDRK